MYSTQSIVIAGAGPVGLFCALRLAVQGISSTVLDNILSENNPWTNNRTIALSYGSMQLLAQSGINLQDIQIQKIEQVNISSQKSWGKCDIYASDYALESVGYVISYKDLCQALYKTCKTHNNICFIAKKIKNYAYNSINNNIEYEIEQDKIYTASMLIISEGNKNANNINKNSALNKISSLDFIYSNNNQYAHVGWLKINKLPKKYQVNTAFERFTNQGPIAILPYKYTADNIDYNYAIIWCNYDNTNESCTIEQLKNQFGYRIGNIKALKLEQIFNLQQQQRKIISKNNIVYIGNAAQSLHPVAGQGLNLGFRQAYNLALHITTHQSIENFTKFMHKDRSSMLATTSIMSNIFTLPTVMMPLLNPSLAFGLNLIDILPSLKAKFAEHFMYGRR